jgi:serine protease Do
VSKKRQKNYQSLLPNRIMVNWCNTDVGILKRAVEENQHRVHGVKLSVAHFRQKCVPCAAGGFGPGKISLMPRESTPSRRVAGFPFLLVGDIPMLFKTRRLRLILSLAVLCFGLAGWSAPAVAAETNAAAAALEKILKGEETPKSVVELRAMQEHLQKLTATLIPVTVGVKVGAAQGSGVIISKDGFVLTAAHVCGKPNVDVEFTFHDGKKTKGKTLGVNREIDSGLMKIDGRDDLPFVEMGVSKELKEGQWCVATGHPGGYEEGRQPVLRFGRILQNRDSFVTTDCTLVGGDSGGPLFDMQGRVIGINSRIATPLNANMHVPVNTYRDTWDRLAKGDAWGNMPGNRPFLGVKGSSENNEPVVTGVDEGTPAARAGIKVGDRILKFDGKEISKFGEITELVGGKEPGDRVTVVVKRGEEELELSVRIGRRGD